MGITDIRKDHCSYNELSKPLPRTTSLLKTLFSAAPIALHNVGIKIKADGFYPAANGGMGFLAADNSECCHRLTEQRIQRPMLLQWK